MRAPLENDLVSVLGIRRIRGYRYFINQSKVMYDDLLKNHLQVHEITLGGLPETLSLKGDLDRALFGEFQREYNRRNDFYLVVYIKPFQSKEDFTDKIMILLKDYLQQMGWKDPFDYELCLANEDNEFNLLDTIKRWMNHENKYRKSDIITNKQNRVYMIVNDHLGMSSLEQKRSLFIPIVKAGEVDNFIHIEMDVICFRGLELPKSPDENILYPEYDEYLSVSDKLALQDASRISVEEYDNLSKKISDRIKEKRMR